MTGHQSHGMKMADGATSPLPSSEFLCPHEPPALVMAMCANALGKSLTWFLTCSLQRDSVEQGMFYLNRREAELVLHI